RRGVAYAARRGCGARRRDPRRVGRGRDAKPHVDARRPAGGSGLIFRGWARGLLRRRWGRLLGVGSAVALVVGLIGALGAFAVFARAEVARHAIAGVDVARESGAGAPAGAGGDAAPAPPPPAPPAARRFAARPGAATGRARVRGGR